MNEDSNEGTKIKRRRVATGQAVANANTSTTAQQNDEEFHQAPYNVSDDEIAGEWEEEQSTAQPHTWTARQQQPGSSSSCQRPRPWKSPACPDDIVDLIDSNFVEYLATVHIEQIVFPDVPTGLAARHLNHISTLLKNGYEHTRGLIVVYADPKNFRLWEKNVKITDLSMRSDLKDVLRVVDGIYRTIYIKTQFKKMREPSGKIVVAVVQRSDGQPIPEDDLFTFGIRKNALSAQTKKMSTAYNINICNSVVRTIERQLNVSVRKQSILWLQKRIQKITNKKSVTNVNSIRPYAELALKCCGRPDVQEVIDRILRSTPQIGISHIILSESITADLCVLELYLLSLRKALVPSLCGPVRFDSRHLEDTAEIKGTRIKDMKWYKNEVFKDIERLHRIFEAAQDADTVVTARVIIDTTVCTSYEVANEDGLMVSKEFSYALRDIITDTASKWFSNRITDRVSEVCRSCETFISDSLPKILPAIQEARISASTAFRPFKVPSTNRESGRKKVTNATNNSSCTSPSEYNSDEISSARCTGTPQDKGSSDRVSDMSIIQEQSSLRDRLAEVRSERVRLSKSEGVHPPSAEAQITLDPQDETIDSLDEVTLYDDDVPRKDPLGCLSVHRRNMQESRAREDAKRSLKLGFHMQLWRNEGLSEICMAAVMRALYLKPNHRASLWLTYENLTAIHKEVQGHLSTRNKRRSDGFSSTYSVHDRDGMRSLLESNRLRGDLDGKGWCIVYNCEFLNEALQTMETVYETTPDTVHGNAVWEIIRNARDESMKELTDKGHGRRQTSKYGVMELLENGSEAWKQRAKLDVVIGLYARAMRLGNGNDEQFDLFMPSTGGRWLATDPNTGVQTVHCDHEVLRLGYGVVSSCPGYFVMISGSKGFFLWIADRSHLLNQCGHYKNNPIVVKKVYIPPLSIIFARADVFHAGDKYDSISTKSSIRYHVLLIKKDKELNNEIQYSPTEEIKWIDPLYD